MNHRSPLLAVFLTLCTASALVAWDAPNYRVFRGYRRADVPVGEFLGRLGTKFIPAAPETHQKNGLIAYIPAVLPATASPGSPDEIAIVIYESAAVYDAARNSPEGKKYSELHWTLFESPSPAGESLDDRRTKSHSAVPFARDLKIDEPVDVFNTFVDWQGGHTAVFVGSRAEGITADRFAAEVSLHVAMARDAFAPKGLDGYIAVIHSEKPHGLLQEIAWMHWKSKQDMEAALATPAGQKVARDAARLFKNEMWTEAPPFAGTIAPGQAVNVKFTPRPR